jgi:uncharacterized protein (DUF433 family)
VLTRAGELLRRHASFAWARRVLRDELLGTSLDRDTVDWRRYVHADPAILAGKPVVKGTGLGVGFLLELLAAGWTSDQVLRSYSTLTPETLRAVFAFAATRVDDPRSPRPPSAASLARAQSV